MPYDDDMTNTANPRDESARAKRSSNQTATKASPSSALFGEMGPRNVKAALRLQMEMFDVLHDVGRDWLKRAASEAELAFNLPNKLTAAQTIPAALSAYQEWLSEWMSMVSEDGRHFIADRGFGSVLGDFASSLYIVIASNPMNEKHTTVAPAATAPMFTPA